MQVDDIFYHGVRQQIRRVLRALGTDRIDKGLTAFDDGESSWSNCFFARALAGEMDLTLVANPSWAIAGHLTDPLTHRRFDTVVPIKIVWHLFDGIGEGRTISKAQLKEFIESVLDESRPQEVLDLIKSVDMSQVETRKYECLHM